MCAWAQTAAVEPEWVYRVVAGDNLTAIGRNYLQPPYTWESLQQRNQLRDPNYLAPGSALVIPVAWLRRDVAVAEVIFVRGDTGVKADAASTAVPANVGDRLKPGAALSTGMQSSLVLRLADGSRLMLAPQTQVTLERLLVYGRSGLSQATVQVLTGGVDAQVPPRASPVSPLEIRTPTATLGVRGTQFRVSADAQAQTSRVEVLSGSVAAKGGRAASGAASGATSGAESGTADVRVEAGFGLVAGATLGEPRKLLPAPDMVPAAPRFTRPPVRQEWLAVPGATAYRAQLFGDAQGSQLLSDLTLAGLGAQWDTLAGGRYWLHVRGIAADGLEGADAVAPFEMSTVPDPTAPLLAWPPDGDTLTGNAAGLAWTATGPATRYRLQVAATADFSAPTLDLPAVEPGPHNLVQVRVPLAPGRWHWRVAAVSADGIASPFSRVQSFTLRTGP